MYLGPAPELGGSQPDANYLQGAPPSLVQLWPTTHASEATVDSPRTANTHTLVESTRNGDAGELLHVPEIDPRRVAEDHIIREVMHPLGNLVTGREVDLPELRTAINELPADESLIIGALASVPDSLLSRVVDRLHLLHTKALGERLRRGEEERFPGLLPLLNVISWMREPDYDHIDPEFEKLRVAYRESESAHRQEVIRHSQAQYDQYAQERRARLVQ